MIRALRQHPDIKRIVVITEKKKIAHNADMLAGNYDVHYVCRNATEANKVLLQERPDIIHCHNYPDFATIWALRGRPSKDMKVIHDNHDVGSLGNYYDYNFAKSKIRERVANTEVDGRIFVSPTMQKYIQKRFGLHNDLVFPSYADASISPPTSYPSNGAVIYQGALRIGQQRRNSKPLFQNIVDKRMHLHVYPSNPIRYNIVSPYYHPHKTVPASELYKKIPTFEAGLNILNADYETGGKWNHSDMVLPNKLFEYLTCGIPIISTPDKDITAFIKKYKVGYTTSDFNDIQNLVKKARKLRSVIFNHRHKFTMQANIDTLVNFYKKTLGG